MRLLLILFVFFLLSFNPNLAMAQSSRMATVSPQRALQWWPMPTADEAKKLTGLVKAVSEGQPLGMYSYQGKEVIVTDSTVCTTSEGKNRVCVSRQTPGEVGAVDGFTPEALAISPELVMICRLESLAKGGVNIVYVPPPTTSTGPSISTEIPQATIGDD